MTGSLRWVIHGDLEQRPCCIAAELVHTLELLPQRLQLAILVPIQALPFDHLLFELCDGLRLPCQLVFLTPYDLIPLLQAMSRALLQVIH